MTYQLIRYLSLHENQEKKRDQNNAVVRPQQNDNY